jgi:hypothetical protein
MATDDWTFFSGHNYVKIGFSGNVTNGKNVQSSGRLCFSAGSNYNRKKITTRKKRTVVRRSVGNWKKLRPEKKGTVISSRWLEGKTQNTTHIIDTTTNKMSRATLPSSGFCPLSLHGWSSGAIKSWRRHSPMPCAGRNQLGLRLLLLVCLHGEAK